MTTLSRIKSILAASTARANAATEGPWQQEEYKHNEDEICGPKEQHVCFVNVGQNPDATFIAHARTDVPARDAALLVAVEALEGVRGYIDIEKCTCCVANEAGDVDRCGRCWTLSDIDSRLTKILTLLQP